MEPVSAITSGISAAKTGFDLIKGVRELLAQPDIDVKEILQRLTSIQDYLLEARSALFDAQDEHQQLQKRIAELSRMADFGKHFTNACGLYWYERNPYCPVCWDVDRKPVRLAGPIVVGNVNDHWTCPIHKLAYSMLSGLRY